MNNVCPDHALANVPRTRSNFLTPLLPCLSRLLVLASDLNIHVGVKFHSIEKQYTTPPKIKPVWNTLFDYVPLGKRSPKSQKIPLTGKRSLGH